MSEVEFTSRRAVFGVLHYAVFESAVYYCAVMVTAGEIRVFACGEIVAVDAVFASGLDIVAEAKILIGYFS